MKPYTAVISRAAVETSIESSWCRGFLKVLSDDRPDSVGSSRQARLNRMPVELEAKVKVDSHEPTRQRLRDAGAEAHGSHLQINTFFDTDDRSLRAADKGLRIRVNRDVATGKEEAVLTYKGPRQPGAFKSREEVETTVGSPENFATIVQALGYRQVLSFEKKRESWSLDGCQVELDEVPHLGDFVEVEGPSEEAIRDVLKKLGLESAPYVRESYAGLLSTWLEDRGSRERIVIFPKTGN